MKKSLKRFFGALLIICLCLTAFPRIADSTVSASAGLSLSQLREKFPHGKYWNGSTPDDCTSSPCTHHTSLELCLRCPTSGACGCTSFYGSIQCAGYVEKLGFDATNTLPSSNSNGWYTNYSSSAIDNLKPGDIVRYGGHSIYVTGVYGDTVTFTDCNYGYTCIIRWDQTISKSTLKASFSYVRSAPFSMVPLTYIDLGTSFYANIINTGNGMYVTNDQGNVAIYSKSGGDNQKWYFEKQSDGSYSIISALDSLCIDVDNLGSTNGTNVKVHPFNGNNAQLWYITGTYPNYVLRSKCNNLVVDINNNESYEGTNVQMWEFNGTNAQYYEIKILEDPVGTPLGDANNDGDIDNLDAATILKYDAGIIGASAINLVAADVNGDGSVDNLDSAFVLKYDAGIISGFGR